MNNVCNCTEDTMPGRRLPKAMVCLTVPSWLPHCVSDPCASDGDSPSLQGWILCFWIWAGLSFPFNPR